jgi:SAM-dependent methyltransferase
MSTPTGTGAPLAKGRSRVRQAARRSITNIGQRINRVVFPESAGASDQWQRAVMNEEIAAHLESLGPSRLSAAEISGDAHANRGWKEFCSLNYPDFDLCAPITISERYDVVICEQVLEHVVDPFLASQHLFDLCRPDGHVIVSTPFLIKQHELPLYGMLDYWRFTPRGLRTLLGRAGLEVDHVGTWGNSLGVLGNLDRWSAHRRWLPLRNRPDIAVVVWAFARRPAE